VQRDPRRNIYVLLSVISVAFPGILAYIILTFLIPRDVG
jgi:phage shock protein PspC (stress-responsive transcriptional regulator)